MDVRRTRPRSLERRDRGALRASRGGAARHCRGSRDRRTGVVAPCRARRARPAGGADRRPGDRADYARRVHGAHPAQCRCQQRARRLRRAGARHLPRADAAVVASEVRWPPAEAGPGACATLTAARRAEARGYAGERRRACVKNAQVEIVPTPLALGRRTPRRVGDYVSLAKPRLNLLVVASSAAGYYLGSPSAPQWIPMTQAIAGTALVAGGAAVLNQVYERDTDALMTRTRLRPLPDRRVTAEEARVFGIALSVAGVSLLTLSANALAALVAAATLLIYLAVYTPLKRRSAIATLVGAIPGALPPLIGWTAAHGAIAAGGWTLFAIVFLWQIPHFMAIAWMYRDDYRRAGFPMLPVLEPDGARTGRQAVIYALALVPVSLVPALIGVAGLVYFWFALALGVSFLALAVRFAASRSELRARALFYGSLVYLPLIWAVMILDH